MNAFIVLRAKARERRDKLISLARDEYTATLVRIAALEQDLLGKVSSTHQTIASCINRVIPADEPFTTRDILAALEGLDSTRDWRMRSVVHHLTRLRERKIIRCVRRSRGTEGAIYVRADAKVQLSPFDGKTLREAAIEVMGVRAMTVSELAVAMLEAGYPTTMARKAFRDGLGAMLRRERRAFFLSGTRWNSISPSLTS